MITMLSTTGKWAASGSLLLTGAILLGSAAGADPTGSEGATLSPPVLTAAEMATPSSYDDFRDALKGGKFWLNLRYRYENVSQDGKPKDANASTLRTRLGYETARYNGFTGLLEFSDVSQVPPGATSYAINNGDPKSATYPVVADPKLTVVNQVYLKYDRLWEGDLKLGRQRLNINNERFIGSVGWRQTENMKDSITYYKPDLATLGFFYGYINNVNDIWGVNNKSNHHLVNVNKEWENYGKLTAYGYYLDFDTGKQKNTFSYGLRFHGEHEFTQNNFTLLYTAEMANQNDVANNPQGDTNVSYLNGNIGGSLAGFTLKAGWEQLGGDSDANGNSFQTPLATLFRHNGWADKFLTTPGDGLNDSTVSLGYKWNKLGLEAIYHNFDRDKGSGSDYGSEVDLKGTYKTPWGVDLGISYADFNAKSGAVGFADTQKFWFWMYYGF